MAAERTGPLTLATQLQSVKQAVESLREARDGLTQTVMLALGELGRKVGRADIAIAGQARQVRILEAKVDTLERTVQALIRSIGGFVQ